MIAIIVVVAPTETIAIAIAISTTKPIVNAISTAEGESRAIRCSERAGREKGRNENVAHLEVY